MSTGQEVLRGFARVCLGVIGSVALAAAHAGPAQRVIVNYDALVKGAASTNRAVAVTDAANRYGVSLSPLRTLPNGAQVLLLNREISPEDLEKLAADLNATPGVTYAEVDRLMKPLFVPNDQFFSLQWSYYETPGGIGLP